MNAAQLKVIQQRCVDASPAIRKQACRSLCALLEMNPQAKELQSAWATAVLPLAQDAEPTVSEACLSAVLDGIISPLAKQQKAPSKALGLPLWPLLDQLSGDAVPGASRSRGTRQMSWQSKALAVSTEVSTAGEATSPSA